MNVCVQMYAILRQMLIDMFVYILVENSLTIGLASGIG